MVTIKVLIVSQDGVSQIGDILQREMPELKLIAASYREDIVGKVYKDDIPLCIFDNLKSIQLLKEIKKNKDSMDKPYILLINSEEDIFFIEKAMEYGAFDFMLESKDGAISPRVLCMKVKWTVEQYQKIERMYYLSYHDGLTGLYNKRFFEEELRRLDTDRQLPISIIIGDINHLKITNDVFGHHIGDELLKALSKILKSSCRKEDIVARWGGDEFYIMLPNTDKNTAKKICKRIKKSCNRKKVSNIPISISLGYATKYFPGQNIRDIIRKAEEWMYYHKQNYSRKYSLELLESFKNKIQKKIPDLMCELNEKIDIDSLANWFNLNDYDTSALKKLLYFIDIGYISLDYELVKKKERLNDYEWQKIKEHVHIGYKIAKATPELVEIADLILYHHERWDGKGYPHGLKGKEIPKLCRIVSILNAYDAMSKPRLYRSQLSHREIIKELRKYAGTQFDPEYVENFIDFLNAHSISQLCAEGIRV